MFILLLIIFLGIQGIIIWGPGFFEQEIIISFLPYILIINIILVLGLLVIYLYNKKRRFIGIGILYIVYSLLYIYTINSIFFNHIGTVRETKNSISFFFGNIYYQNHDTNNILQTIIQQNPDIIMLVEYSKEHDETITPHLKKEYPYVSRYIGNKGYDGDIIFSKYPLSTIKHTTIPGSFSHIQITYQTKNLDIALLHTSAPVSKHFFNMRTKQLNELKEILTTYYTTNSSNNLILAGDFNITPWSSYYKTQLSQPLQTIGLFNITNNLSLTKYKNNIPYTRCLKQFPLACAQIDHIWSNNNNIQLEQVMIPGSDHTGFFGVLSLQ